jgi:hypothetical protein
MPPRKTADRNSRLNPFRRRNTFRNSNYRHIRRNAQRDPPIDQIENRRSDRQSGCQGGRPMHAELGDLYTAAYAADSSTDAHLLRAV